MLRSVNTYRSGGSIRKRSWRRLAARCGGGGARADQDENDSVRQLASKQKKSWAWGLGVIYIFTIIRKVTRWISTLKRAPTDLAQL